MPTSIIIILGAGVLFLLLTFLALIDIYRREFEPAHMQAVWVIVVSMLPFLGCLLYFLLGRRKTTSKNRGS
ncbi:MAG: PLD nuclease N-terminal domain-containing protein [Thermodesulfobacteriota bacterium]